MRCSLSREHLTALYHADRTIGLPAKYALVPVMALGALLFNPQIVHRPLFAIGLAAAASGTGALHLSYRRWGHHERPLILACVVLECFFVVLGAALLDAPLEALCAFPILKVTQIMVSVRFHTVVMLAALVVVVVSTGLIRPHRMVEPVFWWGMLSIGLMLASSLVLAEHMRRRLCPSCVAAHSTRTRLRHQMQVQEDERKRIARDLHDSRSQTLVALIIGLDQVIQTTPEQFADIRGQVERIKGIATGMLDDVRRLIRELRPVLLDDLGIEAAVRTYLKTVVEPSGIEVRFEARGLDQRCAPETETAAYRIVQEALANVVRHAEARTVTVDLEMLDGRLTGYVIDDGKGFDPVTVVDSPQSRETFGLVGLGERALMLQGNVRVLSRLGSGTRVEFDIPTTELPDSPRSDRCSVHR